MPKLSADYFEIYGTMQDCKCPRCEIIHRQRIKFIGRGMPRKFCQACLKVSGFIMSGLDDGASFNRKACAMRLSTQP